EFDTVEYLSHPLDRATLENVLALLGGPPAALVRKDRRFAELGLRAEDYVTREQVVALLLKHPELKERPVVVRGSHAVIARPWAKAAGLLDGVGEAVPGHPIDVAPPAAYRRPDDGDTP